MRHVYREHKIGSAGDVKIFLIFRTPGKKERKYFCVTVKKDNKLLPPYHEQVMVVTTNFTSQFLLSTMPTDLQV